MSCSGSRPAAPYGSSQTRTMPSVHLAVGAEVHREGPVNGVLAALARRVRDRHVGDGLELGAGVDLERLGRHERPLLGGLDVDILARLADVELGRVTSRDGAVRDQPYAEVRRLASVNDLVGNHEVVQRGAHGRLGEPPVAGEGGAALRSSSGSDRRGSHAATQGKSRCGNHAHRSGCQPSHMSSLP